MLLGCVYFIFDCHKDLPVDRLNCHKSKAHFFCQHQYIGHTTDHPRQMVSLPSEIENTGKVMPHCTRMTWGLGLHKHNTYSFSLIWHLDFHKSHFNGFQVALAGRECDTRCSFGIPQIWVSVDASTADVAKEIIHQASKFNWKHKIILISVPTIPTNFVNSIGVYKFTCFEGSRNTSHENCLARV